MFPKNFDKYFYFLKLNHTFFRKDFHIYFHKMARRSPFVIQSMNVNVPTKIT